MRALWSPSVQARIRLRAFTERERAAIRPPSDRERSRRSACRGRDPAARFDGSLGLLLTLAQRAADRQDAEANAAQEQRDPDDDAEVRELLGHVARVERGRECRLR